jgi:glycosyltransferase involved in cell wall biosynthesis
VLNRKENLTKLLLVQPYLTKYRLPVFKQLTEKHEVTLLASKSNEFGRGIFDDTLNIETVTERNFFGVFFWQPGLVKKIASNKFDVLLITANPRYLSTWVAVMLAKLKGVNVLLHGQGLYRKKSISLSNRLTYFLYSKLCDQYIAYTQLSKDSFKGLSIYKKTSVAENSIVNNFPIEDKASNEKGILFVGRLRHGSNIKMLIQAIIKINEETSDPQNLMQLHIVGGGENLEQLKTEFSSLAYIHFWGEIYDSQEISKISKHCFSGCYPGDAGLSVLHYMSLSLPAIIHSSMHRHMGPEPSYVQEKTNGIYFERNDLASLKNAIQYIYSDKTQLAIMQKNAFETYTDITEPPLAERFERIIQEVIKK